MDCIKLTVDILTDAIEAPVSTEAPADRPTTLVLVQLAGDYSDEFVLRPRIALTVWGETDRDAHVLAMSCVDALRDASLDHPYLSAAQLESMSREEWTRTGQARYLAEINLVVNTDEE